ncbi:hypothetical protein J4760_07015 [Salinicoccus sp. ID82-1]|uniref:MarR family transcriptional regulator n=1 Tax=Salinicoccus cyprini TaxID=2493691 RepID=A0A558ASX0_9STAP|nr:MULTISPECIES: hypothetical protein [Salinicoccus]MCG1009767.1 hypothetical protein [Salinicoccus sp. ID82-1]TVT27365.1 hypothetical protein FO441_09990 [Salinicoccus cyprini]
MNNRTCLPLQMECIMLFQSDPMSSHSLEELSNKLDQPAEDLESIMEMLEKQGIIEQLHASGQKRYRYHEPEATSEFEMNP